MAASKASTVEALEQVPLLAELTKRDRQRLAQSLTEQTYPPGKQIVIQGRGGIGFFLIVDGKAIVSVGDRVVSALGPGEYFGEMALLDGNQRLGHRHRRHRAALPRHDVLELQELRAGQPARGVGPAAVARRAPARGDRSWSRDVNTNHDEEDPMGMVRRRARRRTALVVGGAAYAAGRHRGGGGDQGYEEPAYDEPPPAAPAPAEPSASIDYDELEKLGKLHADGILTDEEFAAAKANVLGG